MKYLHSRVSVPPGARIVVELEGTEANVMAMDDRAFAAYQRGRQFAYMGGHFRASPAILSVPEGDWNVVVDLGGGRGQVRAVIRVAH